MILETLRISPAEFERGTGWAIKPQGACKGDRCVPLPGLAAGDLDVPVMAERLGMPLIRDEARGIWCLGPDSGDRVLAGALAPELTLPEWRGGEFGLSSLRGAKVLLLAWASW